MVQYQFQRDSRPARWAWRLAAFALVLFVISGIGHRLGYVETVAFFWLLGLVGSSAVVSLAFSWAAFSRLWYLDERGGKRAFAAAVLALLVLAPFAISGVRLFLHPAIADVATDTQTPPSLLYAARLRSGPMNPVMAIDERQAELQRAYYPAVTGRRYEHPPSAVYEAVLGIVQRRGWRVLRLPDPRFRGQSVTIELEARTFMLGFPSDVAIRVRDDHDTSFVDMRSASRFGEHDLGDNASRIVRFLEDLDAEMDAHTVIVPE